MKRELKRRAFVPLTLNDRTIEGVAVRYGDRGRIGYRAIDIIERGAFGSIGDVVLNVQHDRGRAIARTGGGGLELIDGEESLTARASLPDTTDGKDALTLVRANILRGLSMEYTVPKDGFSKSVEGDDDVYTISSATITGLAIVDSPAYEQSVITKAEAEDMPETDRSTELARLAAAEATAIAARDAAVKAQKDAEAQLAELTGENEKLKAERDAANQDREDAEGSVERLASERADLLVMTSGLLPKDFVPAGKSRKEILVAAAGDDVTNAAERSEDYLLARVEMISERRAAARKQPVMSGGSSGSRNAQNGGGYVPGSMGGGDVISMIAARSAK